MTCRGSDQSQGRHTLKHALLYVYHSKWDHNLQNDHHAVLRKTETSDQDHGLIMKLFPEEINQVRKKQASFLNLCSCLLLSVRENAG